MRFSSKPVSSPGRADNFPPLLMRFLRTNVGSRSRGRSRSSPIFVLRKNTPLAETTQEPSSPKVTCMGQVRMTRSKKPKPRPRRAAGGAPPPKRPDKRRRQCSCVQNAFFCHPFSGKLRPKRFGPVWCKWVSFSHVSFPRKSGKRSSSTRSEPIFGRSAVEPDEQESQKEEPEANSIKSFGSTPPRNALLLTRCRSAPYRSSSLASRFWGSPISGGGDEESNRETEQVQKRQQQGDEEEDNNAVSEKASVSGESTTNVAETEGFEDSARESERESGKSEEAKPAVVFGSPRRHLVLTRCKSEPARTGKRLVPDMDIWKTKRLGFT